MFFRTPSEIVTPIGLAAYESVILSEYEREISP